MRRTPSLAAAGRRTCLAILAALALASASAAGETVLDEYVKRPDPAYGWELVSTIDGDGYTAYVLDLKSQTWRGAHEVDRPLWQHWLTIIKPATVRGHRGLLYIGGGRNGEPPPTQVSDRSLRLARDSSSVVADLGMVPNQPLYFVDSRGHGRFEDDLIAYSRVKSIITGDREWLVRLAMVKSGVRAIDALQEFLASAEGGGLRLDEIVVAGGSKRGWTTWLVGAVDPRVVAIMPLVIDALNTEQITRHHYGAYGFFSPALGDYVRHGLYPHQLGSPEFEAILDIEDPYRYRGRDRLRIPKFVVNAAGDQYFLPDNSRFYFAELPSEKYLRYVPNAKHDLAGSDARDSMLAFYRSILEGTPRPRFSWTIGDDGAITVSTVDRPQTVTLWQATNPDARDFRLDTIGKSWSGTLLAEHHPGSYRASLPAPASGYTAFFVELVYASSPNAGEPPFKFTTDTSVVPDTLPFSLAGARGPWLGER